jgi:hypothetical protein
LKDAQRTHGEISVRLHDTRVVRNFHGSCIPDARDGAPGVRFQLFGDGGVAEAAEFFDGDDHLFVRLEPALGSATEAHAFGGTRADDVTGLEWREAGDVLDECGNLEDKVAGIR